MEPLGLKGYDLHKALGCNEALGPVCRGKAPVTAELALRLARYFGTSAELWMGLQNDYDLEEAKERLGAELDQISPHPRTMNALEETVEELDRQEGEETIVRYAPTVVAELADHLGRAINEYPEKLATVDMISALGVLGRHIIESCFAEEDHEKATERWIRASVPVIETAACTSGGDVYDVVGTLCAALTGYVEECRVTNERGG